jgi:disulfide bond formation protein DsbB
VGLALLTQHAFDMLPCPWCVLQRLVFVAIALAALPAALSPAPVVRRVSALLALPLAGAGLAAAVWQHFVASSATSCSLSLADRVMSATGLDQALPSVFAPWASCADAAVKLLGLPYEAWSGALFLVLEMLALLLLVSTLRRGPRAA